MELIKEREQHKELQQEYKKLLQNSPPKDETDQIPYGDDHNNIHDISKDISEILERQHSPYQSSEFKNNLLTSNTKLNNHTLSSDQDQNKISNKDLIKNDFNNCNNEKI